MINPDRVFMQRLKELDKKLGCRFVPSHQHFIITYERPIGSPATLMVVKRDDGGFRQPDNRDINTLCKYDLSKKKTEKKEKKKKKEAKKEVKIPCHYCELPIEVTWRICPYCGIQTKNLIN